MKAQGMGVHKPEEIMEFGQNDLKVLSEMLADKPFFFGDEPTTVSMKIQCDGSSWNWSYRLTSSYWCLCIAVGCRGIC